MGRGHSTGPGGGLRGSGTWGTGGAPRGDISARGSAVKVSRGKRSIYITYKCFDLSQPAMTSIGERFPLCWGSKLCTE